VSDQKKQEKPAPIHTPKGKIRQNLRKVKLTLIDENISTNRSSSTPFNPQGWLVPGNIQRCCLNIQWVLFMSQRSMVRLTELKF
jgi:hypothetical protein